jgi:hypothetical protein
MEMIPVESSQIKEVGYDAETQKLQVRFNHGNALYEYSGVDQGTFDAMMAPGISVGSFHSHNIKGAYPYQRLT